MDIDDLNKKGLNEEWDYMKQRIYNRQGYCCEKCSMKTSEKLQIHISEFENDTDPCCYPSMAYRVLCIAHNEMQNEKCKDSPDWDRVRKLNIKAIEESELELAINAK